MRLTNFATSASFDDTNISAILYTRPGGEVVTQRSAKARCAGSIPALASKTFSVFNHKVDAREAQVRMFLQVI